MFILEWTKLVGKPALGVYLCVSGCPRHLERNYVPLFGVAQSNVELRYYVISRQIVIQILWFHLIMCTVGSIIYLFRGACAIKGNVQVAGHVKRVDHGAVFYA